MRECRELAVARLGERLARGQLTPHQLREVEKLPGDDAGVRALRDAAVAALAAPPASRSGS